MRKILLKILLMNKILRHQDKQYCWCKHHDVKPPERMSLWHMIWHKPIDSLQIAVNHYDAKKAAGWFDFCHKCEEDKKQQSQPTREAAPQPQSQAKKPPTAVMRVESKQNTVA